MRIFSNFLGIILENYLYLYLYNYYIYTTFTLYFYKDYMAFTPVLSFLRPVSFKIFTKATMTGQCSILWIKFINSIMIQQMAVNLGNFNQLSTDCGNQVF